MSHGATAINTRSVKVRLFAGARECAGREIVAVPLPPGATIASVRDSLGREIPALADHLPYLLFAIGNEYARESDVIPEECEVAAFPPVSGG